MKRIFTILCALVFVMAGSITALAADDTGQSASYYPISVEEYTYGERRHCGHRHQRPQRSGDLDRPARK